MLKTEYIGHQFDDYAVVIEAGPTKFFRSVVGSDATGPDQDIIPPTYLFSLWLDPVQFSDAIDLVGIDRYKVLHGEQSFSYLIPIRIGDRITFQTRITDIYSKKNGALWFMKRETRVLNQHGDMAATLENLLVVNYG